jgi:hypothetical protein
LESWWSATKPRSSSASRASHPSPGSAGGGAVGGAPDGGELARGLPGDPGDLGGEPVDLTHGRASAPPQGLGELAYPTSLHKLS